MGDADISESVTLPQRCVAPIVLVPVAPESAAGSKGTEGRLPPSPGSPAAGRSIATPIALGCFTGYWTTTVPRMKG